MSAAPAASPPPADRSTHILLYDDHCPLCTFQMRLLTWLDWCNVLSMQPLSSGLAGQLAPGITRERLLEAIHCISRDGTIYRGARALRFIGMRMPLLVPTALFLWLPGVIPIAEVIYNAVSRNRHLLSRLFGCREACAILPARQRTQDGTEPDDPADEPQVIPLHRPGER